MINVRPWNRCVVALATVAVYALMTTPVTAAHGGGGHGGGGHHAGGGEHHAGGGEHHGGEHHQPHPYHPSQNHADHHLAHHDAHHGDHRNHHHESWHHGDWGPGYWGGYGLGYAGWGGYGYNGGDTYVDNSSNVTPVSDDSDDADSSSDSSSSAVADGSSDASGSQSGAANPSGNGSLPVDDWSELGVVTYAGEYGSSQGQVVVRVVPNSAAAKAGIVPGDVILSLNGQPTPSAEALDTVLDTANGRFTAEVWDARTGRKSTLSGELDANAPAPRDTAAAGPQQQ